jgi:hypothetical protein
MKFVRQGKRKIGKPSNSWRRDTGAKTRGKEINWTAAARSDQIDNASEVLSIAYAHPNIMGPSK